MTDFEDGLPFDGPEEGKTPALSNVPEFTVSELSFAVKRTLEQSYNHIRLRGEISGYRGPHSSGHCYFALKDDKSRVDAVIWKGSFSKLKFKPEEGLEVIATGKVSSYPGSSKYQIVIETLEPAGAGALMALLEERKKKLAAEGLFDDARKKPIPFLPRVIGIVTSPTGAVIRDMLHGFTERFPAHVIVWPVRVQGETCASEVTRAIRGFNALGFNALGEKNSIPKPNLLIVARGGGSLEDLWGFNEESVARAAAESEIPLISAVGHETDWTIIDLVADARAPTPTKAAEWAVPKYSELVERLSELHVRLSRTTRRILEERRSHLTGLARGLPRPQDLVALSRQRFDFAAHRLEPALRNNIYTRRTRLITVSGRFAPVLNKSVHVKQMQLQKTAARLSPTGLRHKITQGTSALETLARRSKQGIQLRLERARGQMESASKLMNSLSYQSVIKRGFALIRGAEGQMLRSVQDASPGQLLDIELSDGHVQAEVTGHMSGPKRIKPQEKTQAVEKQKQSSVKSKKTDAGQGSLF